MVNCFSFVSLREILRWNTYFEELRCFNLEMNWKTRMPVFYKVTRPAHNQVQYSLGTYPVREVMKKRMETIGIIGFI